LLKFIVTAIALMLASPVLADSAGRDANIGANTGPSAGIAAFKAGDLRRAKDLLTPIALAGDVRAKRYIAYILLDTGLAADFNPDRAVELLDEAARQGDYAALIKLETLRREGLAYAPTLQDIIDVEIDRGKAGDPVVAWRLAQRYENGDGVEPSEQAAMAWLEVAAAAPVNEFPKSGDAAYKLCVKHAQAGDTADIRAARGWCSQAAERGDVAAAVMLGRLAL